MKNMTDHALFGAHFYELTPQGQLVFIGANRAADAILGIDNRDYIGKTIEEAFPHLTRTTIPADFRQVIETGASYFKEPVDYPRGVIRGDFEIHAFKSGINCLTVFFLDCAERKRTTEALHLFKYLVEHSSDAIGMSTPEGKHYYQNESFDHLFGDIGETPPDTLYVAREIGLQVFETIMAGGSWQGEVQMFKRDGSILDIFLRAFAIRNQAGRIIGLVGQHTDFTARKQAELAKAKLEEQLLQSQKLESVGLLAGGVAHDFNNMLGVILGRTEIALGKMDPADPIYNDLMEIQKAANRSADLTRQLLAFARKQTVSPRVLDLNGTIAGMLHMLQRLIGEHITLVWRPSPDLWPVNVDPAQIDQIMTNLCVNARDAISGQGRITVETENVVFDKAYCSENTGHVPGEYALIRVSDNGCGMPQEAVARIFEPFFTTKSLGLGTGLGLATVYGAVKQNNGFITVQSEPAQGATFSIHLPRHVAITDQTGKNNKTEPGVHGQETILLVEDEPAILQLTTMMLQRQGYTIIPSGSPGEAIRLAAAHSGRIHLVMTDVVMPEMNGRDLASRMVAAYPGIKCLFMSGYTADVIADQGVLNQGLNFIQKPFSMKALTIKVREVLDQP